MEKTEFVKEFSEFYAQVMKQGIEATLNDVATLYAIYRKDLRTDRLNGNYSEVNSQQQEEPATDKQKKYLMDLAYKKGVCITQKELDRMTREQASETIDTLTEGDRNSPSSSVFISVSSY